MDQRIAEELVLLRGRYPGAEYRPEGYWIMVPRYVLPSGWSTATTNIAFQVPVGFPGTPPYAFYVPVGLRCGTATPTNYTEPAPTQPPFGGTWGCFSWALEDGHWRPAARPDLGSNLLNWVIGFAQRFREGA